MSCSAKSCSIPVPKHNKDLAHPYAKKDKRFSSYREKQEESCSSEEKGAMLLEAKEYLARRGRRNGLSCSSKAGSALSLDDSLYSRPHSLPQLFTLSKSLDEFACEFETRMTSCTLDEQAFPPFLS